MDSHYLVSTARLSSSDIASGYMKQFTAGMYQSECDSESDWTT